MLSSVVVILVSTTFLVQTRYYSSQTLFAGAHDNVRAETDRIASEIRPVMEGGFLVAGGHTLTVRSPVVLAMVCDRQSTNAYVHFEGGVSDLDTDEITGVAARDMTTGVWTYRATSWAGIDGGAASAAPLCASAGADTTGATAEFRTIIGLQSLFGSTPDPGVVLMLYRQTTFKIDDSALEPGTLGLFRQPAGESAVEFATGMDPAAKFQYRTGGTTYADTITSASLDDIDAVRLVADARKRALWGRRQDVTFGWTVDVPLRNVN
jgi:hypothetical protein